MVAEPQGRRWSVEEYLWLEQNSLVKHDFVDGTVYALAGGTRAFPHRHQRRPAA